MKEKEEDVVPFVVVEKREDEEKKVMKVIVKFNGTPTNDKELTEYFDKVDAIYKKNIPFVIIYDTSNLGFLMNPTSITQQADFMKKHDKDTKRLIIKCVVIVNNAFIRKVLDGIFAIRKPVCDLSFVQTMQEAKDMLRKTLLKYHGS